MTSSSSPIVRPSSPASRVATRSLTRRPAAALDPGCGGRKQATTRTTPHLDNRGSAKGKCRLCSSAHAGSARGCRFGVPRCKGGSRWAGLMSCRQRCHRSLTVRLRPRGRRWLENHHGGLGRAARGVGVEVLVDLSPARPESLALGSRGGSCPDTSWSVACLDAGVRMSLQVQPPRGLGGTPAVHRHRDQVSTVLEVADEDLSRPSRASTGRGEPKRAPTVRLRPPQTQPGARHAHQRAMAVPERHDEPARRQRGAATARTRPFGVTSPGHDTIVTLSRAAGQGRRARSQRRIREIDSALPPGRGTATADRRRGRQGERHCRAATPPFHNEGGRPGGLSRLPVGVREGSADMSQLAQAPGSTNGRAHARTTTTREYRRHPARCEVRPLCTVDRDAVRVRLRRHFRVLPR